jgi:hypothetical protein
MGRFPCFLGSMRRSESRTTLPPRFVSFAEQVPPPPVFRSRARRAPIALGPGLFSGFPNRLFDVESYGPPRFLGGPLCACPALRPRWERRAGPLSQRAAAAFRSFQDVGSHKSAFEAQSHGLHTRCLRFAARVTPAPRKTRFRMGASLSRAGFSPARSLREVSAFLHGVLLTQASPGARDDPGKARRSDRGQRDRFPPSRRSAFESFRAFRAARWRLERPEFKPLDAQPREFPDPGMWE